MGFDLLDRKRNILIRELMTMIDSAKKLRGQISSTYARAYVALQRANITLGVIEDIENRALARLWVFLMALARR